MKKRLAGGKYFKKVIFTRLAGGSKKPVEPIQAVRIPGNPVYLFLAGKRRLKTRLAQDFHRSIADRAERIGQGGRDDPGLFL